MTSTDFDDDDDQRPTSIVNDRRGWSASGDLFTGDAITTVPLQVQFPEPDVYTILFGITPPAAINIVVPPIPTPFDAMATVQWAVNGNIAKRVISIANGTSISGTAENVIVTLFDNTVTNNKIKYQAFALITKGVRADRGLQPVILYWSYPKSQQGGANPNAFNSVQSIPAGASLQFNIPPDAGVIGAEITLFTDPAIATPAAPNVSVQQLNPVPRILKIYNPVINTSFITIVPGATSLKITNFDLVNAIDVAVTWSIDG